MNRPLLSNMGMTHLTQPCCKPMTPEALDIYFASIRTDLTSKMNTAIFHMKENKFSPEDYDRLNEVITIFRKTIWELDHINDGELKKARKRLNEGLWTDEYRMDYLMRQDDYKPRP